MFLRYTGGLFFALVLGAAPARGAESEPPRSRITFTASQFEKLRQAIQSDAGAAGAFDPVKKLADKSLGETPNPIRRIVSEGRLHTDPEKKKSLAARRDLFKIEALGLAYALAGKASYGEKTRDYILAWVGVYEPDGNPINETEFPRLMKAYDLTRTLFPGARRSEVEAWLRRMSERQRAGIRPTSTTSKNNHHSHRLKIVGHVAFLLPDPDLIRWVVDDARRHLEVNLNPDGSTFDFHQRDALHYHVYDLLPLVELAIAADKNKIDLYGYTTRQQATLEKSIAFLILYITGKKEHREFVRSMAKFDAERSGAEDPSIRVGEKWDPRKAKLLFDLAGYFTPSFHQVKFPDGDGRPSFDRLIAAHR